MKENANEKTAPIISQELVERAKAKDREALGELYKKTQLDIYRTIHSMIRDEDTTLDIQQDTYLRAFSCLDQLRDAASFLPWLRQIAVNEARAQLRKKHPLAFSELSSDEDEDYFPDLPDLSLDSSPELSLDRKENNRLIREILSGLSDGQRMLLGMFYYEQMPLKQIAEETGLSVNTIKVQLHRGRKRVETEVKKLEAQGVKLYGLAPLPFLLALWRQQSPAAQAGEAVLAQTLEKAGVSAGAKAVAAAASGGAASGAGAVAIHVGRSFFETGAGKLVLGVIVAGVIGGGAAGYRWLETHRNEPEIQTTEAQEELRVIPTAPHRATEEVIAVAASYDDDGEDLTTEPETVRLQPTEPKPTEPKPAEPKPTEPKPAEPKPTEPKPTEPKPTEPKPTEPGPAEPGPVEPGPAEPGPAESGPAEPGPAEPGPADPGPSESTPTEPKPAEPTPTEPEPTEPSEGDENLDVGGCGVNLTWTYDKSSGVLTISGSGAMTDYSGRTPWWTYRDKLTTVVLSSGITYIGDHAFRDCSELVSVDIPAGVEQLSDGVFYGCTKLERVTLPDGMTTIGDYVFYGCTGLKQVALPKQLTRVGEYAFCKCSALRSVALPDSLTDLGKAAFFNCGALTKLTLPKNLSRVADDAFGGCYGLTSVTFPAGLTGIGAGSFSCCTGLKKIDLPESLRSIGNGAFWECDGLQSLVFPASLVRIGATAFDGCDSLTSVTFSEGLTNIGAEAFLRCLQLSSVTVPSSVTTIGAHALGYLEDGTGGKVKLDGFTIYGADGSAAQAYAEENGFPFVAK